MNKILDEGLDEVAARSHQGFGIRMVVTFAAISLISTMLPWRICLAWVCAQTISETFSWVVSKPQSLGKAASPGRRVVMLITLATCCIIWSFLGGMLWMAGTPETAVSAVLIWLSVIMFTQTNAYQSPTGFIVGGAVPGLGMLTFVLLGPNPLHLPLLPVGGLFILTLVFASEGAMRALAVRQKFNEAQAKLAASEAEYRVLADNITDVISVHEQGGRGVFISPSVRSMMGYEPEELLSAPNDKFIHADDVPWVTSEIRNVLAGEGERTLQYRVLRKDRSEVWVETSFGTIPSPDPNAAARLLSLSRNIESRKAMETELVEARERAETASAAKSDFLANMTHELRTPLNAIIGFAGILKTSQRLVPEDAHHVGLIHEASGTLLELVNSVLDFSKLEAGGVELESKPFDPAAPARAIVSLLAEQAALKGLSLSVETVGEIAPLLGDPARIRQVLLNFLSNALKFTQTGGVVVTVRQSPAGPNQDLLRVEVADSGIGVAQQNIEQLFDRFTQADASVSREYGGTGLGLAISKRTLDLMGGTIGADSRPGQGSTFWFEVALPHAEALVEEVAAATPESPNRALRLLLVEDVAVNRELVITLLRPFDVEIASAENGALAVEAMKAGAFDLILMDVQMPVMDGLTATREIRALASLQARETPIVAMTANILPEQIEKCMAAGMDDHLGKPISPAALLGALSRWSDGRDSAQAERLSA